MQKITGLSFPSATLFFKGLMWACMPHTHKTLLHKQHVGRSSSFAVSPCFGWQSMKLRICARGRFCAQDKPSLMLLTNLLPYSFVKQIRSSKAAYTTSTFMQLDFSVEGVHGNHMHKCTIANSFHKCVPLMPTPPTGWCYSLFNASRQTNPWWSTHCLQSCL